MSAPRTGFAFLDVIAGDGAGRASGGVLAFAHRGGADHPETEGLENTLTAFAHAVALGYRYLETDVHVTLDGVLVAFHDEVLDRVTDTQGAIADLTYEQVRQALVGGREHVPTLAELVDAFPDARFNIDIKAPGAVAALVADITEHDLWDRVLVGAFNVGRLARFRAMTGGRVPTSANPLEVALFRFLPSGRLANLLTRGRVAALQIPHRQGPIAVATRGMVRRAHRAGKHVHVWTIDDPQEMRQLLDLGVDGIFTDRTDLLEAVLVERGEWRG